MLLDNENLFCENQEITTGTIYSQNVINFGKNDVSFVPVIVQAVSDFSNLSSLTVKIQSANNPAFDNSVDLIEAKLNIDSLKAGSKFPINYLPKGNLGYMRLAFVVEGTSETTGKITAGVVAGDGLSSYEI